MQFKWSPKSEDLLEEILIKHSFDFKSACREFVKEINQGKEQFYQIDVKTLQLRWTDIEIRKYRLNNMEEEKPADEAKEDDEEELPPLEQKPAPEIRTNLFQYADGSSSEEE